MDDSEYVLAIEKHLRQGWAQGTWSRLIEHAQVDLRTGIFRPSFWWYTALAYQLPVRLAYFSRFLEYALIFFCTYQLLKLAFQKYTNGARSTLLFASLTAVLSIRSLYEGIAFFSLQEFTGLFFITLAYFFYASEWKEKISLSRLVGVVVLLVLGVGFKPPFVWIYFLFAIGLIFFEKRKFFGMGILVFGFVYFYFTMRLAQTGFYSQEIYQFGYLRIFQTLFSFFKHLAPVGVVLMALPVFLFSLKFLSKRPGSLSRIQVIGLQMFGAGAMYTATLLPRGIGNNYGYYFGPPIFLLVIGFLLSMSICVVALEKRQGWRMHLGKVTLALVAAGIFLFSMKTFVQRNLAVAEFKNWALENNDSRVILATNSYEVAVRLGDIYFLNFGEPWKGQIKNLTHNSPYPEGVTHYLVFCDQVEPRRSAMGELVWEKGSAQLVRIRQETP